MTKIFPGYQNNILQVRISYLLNAFFNLMKNNNFVG
ncbi:hypothetical protein NB701_003433 [Pantoea ananatis]|nr:hypothetical protein [Pantoea ananatis]